MRTCCRPTRVSATHLVCRRRTLTRPTSVSNSTSRLSPPRLLASRKYRSSPWMRSNRRPNWRRPWVLSAPTGTACLLDCRRESIVWWSKDFEACPATVECPWTTSSSNHATNSVTDLFSMLHAHVLLGELSVLILAVLFQFLLYSNHQSIAYPRSFYACSLL